MNETSLIKQPGNQQIPKKVKLKLEKRESEFLSGFLMTILQKTAPQEWILEQLILADFFKRYLERFTLMLAGKFTLSPAESVALKRYLFYTPMTGQADEIRNYILGILDKKITFF